MKIIAAVLENKGEYPVIRNDFKLDADPEMVTVDLKYAALNHRDLWILKGRYPRISYPIILGSDGCGLYQGKRVLINPGLFWGHNEAYQSPDFQVLGLPTHGCFAQKIQISPEYIHEVPYHLSFAEAAGLPLAGLTAFRALFSQGQLKPGEKLLVNGGGGGVAQVALAFAKAIGCKVYVTTGSDEKLKKLANGGIDGVVNYNSDSYIEKLKLLCSRFDLILDSAGGSSLSQLIPLIDYGGRIVIYGGTTGNIENISPQILFWRQAKIIGSTMGSPRDFKAMLNFVKNHKIKVPVDRTFELEDIASAFDRLDEGKQIGKIVIRIPE